MASPAYGSLGRAVVWSTYTLGASAGVAAKRSMSIHAASEYYPCAGASQLAFTFWGAAAVV